MREVKFYRWVAVGLVGVLLILLASLLFDFLEPVYRRAVVYLATVQPPPTPATPVAEKGGVAKGVPTKLRCTQEPPQPQAGRSTRESAKPATPAVVTFSCEMLVSDPPAASGAGTAPSASSEPPKTVDSSINLIAVVIALVALILTVGTSWFAQKQVEIGTILRDMEERQKLGVLLARAKSELLSGLRDKMGDRFASTDGPILAAELDLLMSPSAEQRQRAYMALRPYFGSTVRNAFPEILNYS